MTIKTNSYLTKNNTEKNYSTYSSIDNLIFYMMCFLVLIDSFNGYLIREHTDHSYNISQIYKSTLLFFTILRLASLNAKSQISYLFILFLIPITSIFTNILFDGHVSYIYEDLGISLRTLLIPTSFFYFKHIILSNPLLSERRISKIFSINFFVIIANILLGNIGHGYYDYWNDTGSLGFLYSGNETSILICIFSGYFLHKAYKAGTIKYLFILILTVTISFSKATKTAIITTFLFGGLVPTLQNKFQGLASVRKLILVLFSSAIIVLLFSDEISNYIIKSNIYQKYEYQINNANIEDVIFSGRTKLLGTGLDIYLNKFTLTDYISGKTAGGFREEMSYVFGMRRSIEMDTFDILFFYGPLQVVLIYGFWINTYLSIHRLNARKHENRSIILFLLTILLTISTLSGHVMLSGMPGMFIGSALALGFSKSQLVKQPYTRPRKCTLK
ncbi:MAG: hypothetical protein C0618_10060 [Desulfuromonas sp.]|nr:MAG: hypothetical protein C0618_10060 [Desulfuromonas sp.]